MVTSFQNKVYNKCKKIPLGKVSTYKEIAISLNCKCYRAVGHALNQNPFAPQVPCHRIVSSDGGIGGFASGTAKKIKILEEEGIRITNNKFIKDFKKKLFKFKS
jgi:methylated-DNA-[protein]-cysteine S-methyltransferase